MASPTRYPHVKSESDVSGMLPRPTSVSGEQRKVPSKRLRHRSDGNHGDPGTDDSDDELFTPPPPGGADRKYRPHVTRRTSRVGNHHKVKHYSRSSPKTSDSGHTPPDLHVGSRSRPGSAGSRSRPGSAGSRVSAESIGYPAAVSPEQSGHLGDGVGGTGEDSSRSPGLAYVPVRSSLTPGAAGDHVRSVLGKPPPVPGAYTPPPGNTRRSGVLEASLKRLHQIHDGIHRLRELNSNKKHSSSSKKQETRRQNLKRHSSSCPSLAEPKLQVINVELELPPDEGNDDLHKSMLHLTEDDGLNPDSSSRRDVRRTSSDLTDRTMAGAGQHLEPQVQICINDVTVDSSSTDFASNCTDLELLIEKEKKAQKRRSSWCPEEAKKKQEQQEKKQMLAISGRSQSLSSLDGQEDSEDDDDEDDASSTSSYHDNKDSSKTCATYSGSPGTTYTDMLHASPGVSSGMYGYSSVADYVNSSIYSAASGSSIEQTYKYVTPPARNAVGASSSHRGAPSRQPHHSDVHLELQDSRNKAVIGPGPVGIHGNQGIHGYHGNGSTPEGDLLKSTSSPTITTAAPNLPGYIPGRKSDTDLPVEYVLENSRQSPVTESTEKSSHHSHHDSQHEAVSTEEEDKPRREKPRRPSVFSKFGSYRKKVPKDNKIIKNTHHFVSVSFSNSTSCDVCSKSMANKPALQCENCLVNVHENTCKDQIAPCARYGGNKSSSQNEALREKKSSSLPEGHGTGTNLKGSQSFKEKRATSVPSRTAMQVSQSASVLPRRTTSPSSNGPTTGYFQWRRVATKLGIDRVISEERGERDRSPKEEESTTPPITGPTTANLMPVPDSTNMSETMSASMESLEEGTETGSSSITGVEFENDPDLQPKSNEPEAWSVTVDKKTLKKMSAKDIKRQDHIWELVQTEKSHCRTLRIMQKIFSHGMQRELNLSRDMVDRIFPKLDDLLDIHTTFLHRLTDRQRLRPDLSIEDIGDILVLQFEGEMGHRMKMAYGDFCSRHNEAVQLYKDLLKADRKFQAFIKKCSRNNLCKRLGIPECILLVTQRMTKYPLLIEPIIKTTKETKADRELLGHAHYLAKEILSYVDAQVDANEKYQRLIEIFNKLDARSSAMFKGKKFKKSDLLSNNRKLFHEGLIKWMSARGKPTETFLVILSDVLFFLSENNQKYSFFSQDNKSSVISLSKLLVREKGDTRDSKGIYLICQSKTEPEMYELVCRTSEERKSWIATMRTAIAKCPDEDEGRPSESEEERKLQEARSAKVRQLVDKLHRSDQFIRQNCEEKMKVLIELLELFRKEDSHTINLRSAYKDEDGQELMEPGQLLQAALHEGSRLTTLLQGTASSTLHHQEEPKSQESGAVLPKRAETFSGFDGKEKENVRKRYPSSLTDEESRSSSLQNLHQTTEAESFLTPESATGNRERMSRRMSTSFLQHLLTRQHVERDETTTDSNSSSEVALTSTPPVSPVVMAAPTKEQTQSLAQIIHYLHALVCTVTQQATQVESLRAQLADSSSTVSRLYAETERLSKHGGFHHDKQLEELRNLQETIQSQKLELSKVRGKQDVEMESQRNELSQMKAEIENEKTEMRLAREELQREKEALQRQIDFFEEKKKAEARAQEERSSPNYLRGPRDRSESPGPRFTTPSPGAPPHDVILHKRSASDDLQSMRIDEGSEVRHPPQRTPSSVTPGTSTPPLRRESVPLPIHLLSKTNEEKLGPVPRQALPLQLASHGGAHAQLFPGKLAKKSSPSVSVSVSTSVVMSSSSYTLRTATINTATMSTMSSTASPSLPGVGNHGNHHHHQQQAGGGTPRSHTQPVNMLPMKLVSSSAESKKSKQRPRSASSVVSPTSSPLGGASQSQDTPPGSGGGGGGGSSASPVHSQPSSKRKEPQIIYF